LLLKSNCSGYYFFLVLVYSLYTLIVPTVIDCLNLYKEKCFTIIKLNCMNKICNTFFFLLLLNQEKGEEEERIKYVIPNK